MVEYSGGRLFHHNLPLFRHCRNIPAFVRIFRHLSEYSDNCSGEVPIFSHFKTKAACSNVFTSELKTEEASVWQNGRCRCQCHGVCGSYYSVKGRNIPLQTEYSVKCGIFGFVRLRQNIPSFLSAGIFGFGGIRKILVRSNTTHGTWQSSLGGYFVCRNLGQVS